MSELGELLEVIHGAHAQLSTFEAEYRDWTRPQPSVALSVERSELGEPLLRWHGAGPFPRTVSSTRRIWLLAPDRVRVEIASDGEVVRMGVRDGANWLRWDHVDGVVRNDVPGIKDGPLLNPPPLLSPPLIQPVPLLAVLWFEPTGRRLRAGREVLAARARPRHPSASAQALTYELEFDAEHGTILRRATLDHGEVFSVTEAISVRYQNGIALERFELRAPDGESAPLIRSP